MVTVHLVTSFSCFKALKVLSFCFVVKFLAVHPTLLLGVSFSDTSDLAKFYY